MPNIRHQPEAPTGIRVLPAGSEVDAHRHDDHQIVYAGRGVLSVTTSEGSWVAPATRAIWVPAGTVHEHRAHGDTDLHMVGLPVSDNPLGLDGPAVLGVDPLLRELIPAYTEAGLADRAERDRMLAVLLDRLRRSPQRPVHVPAGRDPRLVAMCALLRADPADDRTLAELGARVGASERTLSRLCRAELGMTFPRWRTQVRLHRALLLLAEGTPVTVVAHRCGWASASAFIDVFRRAFGHTPGAHPHRLGAAPDVVGVTAGPEAVGLDHVDGFGEAAGESGG
ncbi:AraC family transcriptional regulator [Phytomonospora endophytica]|uniref:HTH-type transcriptional regulator RipA n=1 Tax=Phytomonospora endophytica TaxID=714109 RepID=A0A841FJ53_9ACTN|nr:helix-turn-helix transcriptional regulator [Phytomonospora endophytica]MBB6035904.1 AraC-like DNA-binding protein [Phytomonospora endophytica]GIG71100.1 AraC family transcriptional regulator [Phytomonospora endophytica]